MGCIDARGSRRRVDVAMMVHTMEKATQSLAIVLLGIFTIFVIAQRTSTFTTVAFGLVVAFSVGRSLWYKTSMMYGAAIITCVAMLLVIVFVR